MKITHISAFKTGGAGVAAYRLHCGLLEMGIESRFLSQDPPDPDMYSYQITFPRKSIWTRMLGRLVGRYRPLNKMAREVLRIKGNYEIFSVPFSFYEVENHPLVKEADIIHLHWVSKVLDFPRFFSRVKQPIFWTLHDMNPFQGGFHYERDEQLNPNLGVIDTTIRKIKKDAYQKANQLICISPSNWMRDMAKKSELLSPFQHLTIYNGVDSFIFQSSNREEKVKDQRSNGGKYTVLFITERTQNRRKGIQYIMELAQDSEMKSRFDFVAVGKKSKEVDGINFLGTIPQPEDLVTVLSDADVLLMPSEEDNLPNVMVEALMCGLPVVAFEVGGIKEVINEERGLLAKEITFTSLKDALLVIWEKLERLNHSGIRQFAINSFDLQKVSKRYVDVYKKCLSNELDD